jgi:hypothetical protein
MGPSSWIPIMDLSNLLPPSDLLEKARGVEAGLRQRKRLGAAGWFGFVLTSAIGLSLDISNVGAVADLLKGNIPANWQMLIPKSLPLSFCSSAHGRRFG